MKLVIIESSAKKQKLTALLSQIYGGGEYKVIASLGHIRDLPRKELGVDIDNGFRPTYVTSRGKSRTIKMLSKHVSQAAAVYLAADPDREGESIAWHIVRVTHPTVPVYRVSFNEITQAAVQRAFDHPREIDMNLVAAQEARRILDRLVGYKVSPALWRGLDESGLSAGRVQSVALKLVVERQREIDTFEPREYWSVVGTFGVPDGTFEAKMIIWNGQTWTTETFQTASTARQAVEKIQEALFTIGKVEIKDRYRQPPAPFTTSTLQKAVSTHLKISPDKTMSIAQALYEAGYITYTRTDSPAVSDEAAAMAADFINGEFGELYLPKDRRKYKAKAGSQEAHECIRPTDVSVTDLSDELDDYSARVYLLIWQRFIASQMAAALYERTTIYVTGGKCVFMARSAVLKYDGFLRVYVYGDDLREEGADHPGDEKEDIAFPAVFPDQTCRVLSLDPNQHFTRALSTYSEASLVHALEKLEVGRPSTYSLMVSTIRQRKYVRVKKRRLVPTPLGQRVTGFLNENFALIMNYEFTRTMEAALDKIAVGDLDTRRFLGVFWGKFEPLVKPWDYAAPKKSTPKTTSEVCPVCSTGELVIRSSKKGRFLGCSRYPRCKYSRDIQAPAPVLVGRACPACGSQLCVRSRRNSDEKFIGCTAYPDCRHTENFYPKSASG